MGVEDMTKSPNELTAEQVTEFFEQAAKVTTDAWNTQATYFEALVKRNTECFKNLGEARVESFKEMSEATTFNQAFESNLAFEEKVREDLASLQEKNTKSWESLLEQLTTIYTPAEVKPKAKAPKAKAPQAKAAKKAPATKAKAPQAKAPQPKAPVAKKETAQKAA
jgi:cell division septation protein DedD